MIQGNPKLVGITSYLTMFYSGQPGNMAEEKRDLTPTGMWLKDFVLKHKFKEYLTKLVDSEFIDRAKKEGYKYATCVHSYGYFYRSHPGQVSGFKAFKNEKGTTNHSVREFKKIVEEFEDVSN